MRSWRSSSSPRIAPFPGNAQDERLHHDDCRVVDTILSSMTRLVANKAAWEDPAKRQKIEDVALLLQVRLLRLSFWLKYC